MISRSNMSMLACLSRQYVSNIYAPDIFSRNPILFDTDNLFDVSTPYCQLLCYYSFKEINTRKLDVT